jgi:hypothetical protein
MRSRAFRRYKAEVKMWRRLKEDRNQHYRDLTCTCYQPGKAMARFKEQPQTCSVPGCCGNARAAEGPTLQEIRHEYDPTAY